MSLLETLHRSGGIDAIAKELALPPAIIAVGVERLLPHVREGFARLAGGVHPDPDGYPELRAMLDELGGWRLATTMLLPGPTELDHGELILKRVDLQPAARIEIANGVAAESGVDAAALLQIFPLLAMLLGGYISARLSGEERGLLRPSEEEGMAALMDDRMDNVSLQEILDPFSKRMAG